MVSQSKKPAGSSAGADRETNKEAWSGLGRDREVNQVARRAEGPTGRSTKWRGGPKARPGLNKRHPGQRAPKVRSVIREPDVSQKLGATAQLDAGSSPLPPTILNRTVAGHPKADVLLTPAQNSACSPQVRPVSPRFNPARANSSFARSKSSDVSSVCHLPISPPRRWLSVGMA